MIQEEGLAHLREIFPGGFILAKDHESIEAPGPSEFNAAHLFRLCEIFDCKPEELFCSFDEGGRGCRTCGYGGESSLTFEVKRR